MSLAVSGGVDLARRAPPCHRRGAATDMCFGQHGGAREWRRGKTRDISPRRSGCASPGFPAELKRRVRRPGGGVDRRWRPDPTHRGDPVAHCRSIFYSPVCAGPADTARPGHRVRRIRRVSAIGATRSITNPARVLHYNVVGPSCTTIRMVCGALAPAPGVAARARGQDGGSRPTRADLCL